MPQYAATTTTVVVVVVVVVVVAVAAAAVLHLVRKRCHLFSTTTRASLGRFLQYLYDCKQELIYM